jgi:hypothetical protein
MFPWFGPQAVAHDARPARGRSPDGGARASSDVLQKRPPAIQISRYASHDYSHRLPLLKQAPRKTLLPKGEVPNAPPPAHQRSVDRHRSVSSATRKTLPRTQGGDAHLGADARHGATIQRPDTRWRGFPAMAADRQGQHRRSEGQGLCESSRGGG